MGVNGLWTLLSPVARPIALDTLQGRRLAIDSSIWLYQFQLAMRDRTTGEALHGAHILGFLRRITKLLYHGIKPVFVFDGDAPALKKRTIAERKKRKTGASTNLAKTAAKLLAAQLRARALDHAQNRTAAKDARAAMDTGEQIGPNATYLDDLGDAPGPLHRANRDPPTPDAAPQTKKYVAKDQYALPSLDGTLSSRAKTSDPRIATEAELRTFIDEMRPEDFDIDSAFFGNLPIEVKYEIIGDLRVKSRQGNRKRVEQMRERGSALDFSKAQIQNLMQRNTLTQKLFTVTDALGGTEEVAPTRVAGERNREYVLVKQDASLGGGWVLGVKNPLLGNQETVIIDDSDSEEVSDAGTASDEFEEVVVEAAAARSPSPDQATRRALAVEAIRARYMPNQLPAALDPYLDQSSARTGSSNLFGQDARAVSPDLEEDEQIELAGLQDEEEQIQRALYEDALLGNLAHALPLPSALPHVDLGAELDGFLEYVDDEELPRFVPPAREFQVPPSNPFVQVPMVHIPNPFADEPAVDDALIVDEEGSDEFEEVELPLAPTVPPTSTLPLPPPVCTYSPPQLAVTPPLVVTSHPVDPPLPSVFPSLRAPQAPRARQDMSHTSFMDHLLAPLESDSEPDELMEYAGPIIPLGSRRFEGAVEEEEEEIEFGEEELLMRVAPVAPAPALARSPSAPAAEEEEQVPMLEVKDEEVELSRPSPEQEKAQEEVAVDTPFDEVALMEQGVVEDELEEEQEFEEVVVEERTSRKADVLQDKEGEDIPTASRLDKGKGREVTPDSDAPLDWSRSPTPAPRGPPTAQEASRAAFDLEAQLADDEQAEEDERNFRREQDQYADMLSSLRNRKLDEMRNETRGEVARLQALSNTEKRNADGVTRQMATDIKELLILFGIPFVDAPQEAEAECAELMHRSLVDGIVTDDSDVFLFGGSRIYRNMFNQTKYVECYLLSDLEKELGLDRTQLVNLAYLLGSDYVDGLPGIGPVRARELLAEFPGEEGLKEFRDWWIKVQSGKDAVEDTKNAFRRDLKKKLKNLYIEPDWPNPAIARAYFEPNVNQDDEAFSWAGPDLDGLRTHLQKTLSWNSGKVDELLLPLIKRQNDRKAGKIKMQANLGDYFDVSAGLGPLAPRDQRVGYQSGRLQNVVASWRKNQKRQNGEPESEEVDASDEEGLPAPPPKKRAPRKSPASKKDSTSKEVVPIPAENARSPSPETIPTAIKQIPAALKKAPPRKAATGPKRSTAASRKRAAALRGDSSDEGMRGVGPQPVVKRAKAPARKATKRAPVVAECEEDLE